MNREEAPPVFTFGCGDRDSEVLQQERVLRSGACITENGPVFDRETTSSLALP